MLSLLCSLCIFVLLSGCLPSDKRDFSDFRPPAQNMSHTTPVSVIKNGSDVVDEVPAKLKLHMSFSMKGSADISQVLFAISRACDMNCSISQSAVGAKEFAYVSRDRAAIDIIKDLCGLLGLRFWIEEGILHVAKDLPYVKSYTLPFIIGSRDYDGSVRVSGDVSAEKDDQSKLRSTVSANFWKELEGFLDKSLKMKRSDGENPSEYSYALHKYGGILFVNGAESQQKMIDSYITEVRSLIERQVSVSVRVFEVRLSRESYHGINWDLVSSSTKLLAPFADVAASTASDGVSLVIGPGGQQAVLKLISKFGAIRTISNGKVMVLHNQPSFFKVARNEVYFKIDVNNFYSGISSNKNQPANVVDRDRITSKMDSVPVGLLMFIQPAIDPKTNEVTLLVRPRFTSIVRYVNDPAVEAQTKGKYNSKVPVIQVREMDSMVRVKSGHSVVLGGLIEERDVENTSGVPFFSKIPLFGKMFESKSVEKERFELVIMIEVEVS